VRWIVIRQFCLYVQRYVPTTYVPDSLVGRLHPLTFRPCIVSPDQMKILIDALPAVGGGSRWPLRPYIFHALLVLLYSTGLRISEALRLRVDDVDLHDRVLLVRETKFYKSRLVPFSDGLLTIFQHYQQKRLALLGSPARVAPFFPNTHDGHYSRGHLEDLWLRLRRHVGIDGGPRIHDLRHSFATLRLAAWYREGADVEAKLPLLATYMGHASVAATYRYLTILPETLVAASERLRRYSGTIITPAGGHHALV
jgi:integrase